MFSLPLYCTLLLSNLATFCNTKNSHKIFLWRSLPPTDVCSHSTVTMTKIAVLGLWHVLGMNAVAEKVGMKIWYRKSWQPHCKRPSVHASLFRFLKVKTAQCLRKMQVENMALHIVTLLAGIMA